MNKFINGLIDATNIGYTENGAIKRNTTKNNLYDMFGIGGAYRSRSESDIILLFKKAFEEDESLALKCLFYLRDARGGQGQRRFFRVCMRWLATEHPEAALRNMVYCSEYGRWDDLFVFFDTKLEDEALQFIRKQLELDVQSKTPSLLAKWLKSENTSSHESQRLARRTRQYLGMTARQYRKTLAILRARINVLEALMSANRWDEIEFDKIPSKAGLIYKNAFARRDMIKAKYETFAKDKTTKVNAKTLYPYEVVDQALRVRNEIDRQMVNKYWDNLAEYFNNKPFNGLAVVDTSASMRGTPLNVAISLGMYCAEHAKGPFAGHYIAFSSRPRLIATEGVDFCDKVHRIYQANLCENTNLKATFDMLLRTAITSKCKVEDMPQTLIVISDMEIDGHSTGYGWGQRTSIPKVSEMETIRNEWTRYGYQMPNLIYWNVDARQDTFLDLGPGVTYVSGFSPVIFEQVLTGKTGIDLMLDKLLSQRYEVIK